MQTFLTRTKAAAIIGRLSLFGLLIFGTFYFFSKGSGQKNLSTERTAASVVGEVTDIVGQADHRLPKSMEFAPLTVGALVVSGELILTHDASQVTLSFSKGASVRLEPGSRLVAEKDSSHAGSSIATVLEGEAVVLTFADTPDAFRLFKNGRDITSGTQGPATVASGRILPHVANEAVVVTATTPAETPTPAPLSHVSDETGVQVSLDSLSNEEIRKALRSAGGFFQRCYLTYLNRVKPGVTTRASTITVGFIISNMGKVRDAKIVRTDIADTVLNNCIIETVQRTPFRAFKAADIPILEFPIELR